ncbi:duplicated ATPase component BL0693 of energizing module of predicted ECF transporter [Cutibacterium acnes JCM 18918]|nr:duplicated ATPase component BL0693 of energizing module of predicted ECF transporter [Cutibacterium acnes JCM 18918]
MSIVSLNGVSYGYPSFDPDSSPFSDGPAPEREFVEQLRGITMTIQPGTLTLLVGASGSGKSTLLRTMNGLVPQFFGGTLRGHVMVQGTDLAGVELHDVGRTSAMIFQNPRTQFFTSSVRTELAFGLENYGVDPVDIREAVSRAVSRTGISHLLDRHLDTLSGGELQRVACACALVADVDLLLFDEPTLNLSAEGIDDFRALVTELKAANKTLVIAEHRLHLFRGLVDDVHRVSNGQIVERMSGSSLFALTEGDLLERGLRSLDVNPVDLPAPPQAPAPLTPVPRGKFMRSDPASAGCTKNPGRADHRAPRLLLPSRLDDSRHRFPVPAWRGGDDSDRPEWRGEVDLGPNRVRARKKSPTEARIVMGVPWTPGRRQKCCGMVMQDVRRQLFSESVEREVTLGLDLPHRDAADVSGLLKRLDLAGEHDRHPLSLSGGQAQRLVVAATIAQDKEVVIFDEPTSGVDRRHLASIADLVGELATAGKVVIVITHDPELMARCGDFLVNIATLKGKS